MGRLMNSPLSIPDLPNYTSDEPRFKLDSQKNDILPDFKRSVAPVQLFIEKALQSRLELKSLAIQLQLNQANASANYVNVIPNPSFAFGKSTAGNPATGPKLTAVFMTLNQELPVCNVQQGAIYQYKATRYQLGYQIASQENQVIGDVSNAYYNLIALRDKIRIYQERLLPDSNEVARLAQRSYEVGQSNITDALQAQQTYIQTQNDYLLTVTAYASAFSDLEFAIGKPLQ
jgi:outer membrane protein TolC